MYDVTVHIDHACGEEAGDDHEHHFLQEGVAHGGDRYAGNAAMSPKSPLLGLQNVETKKQVGDCVSEDACT